MIAAISGLSHQRFTARGADLITCAQKAGHCSAIQYRAGVIGGDDLIPETPKVPDDVTLDGIGSRLKYRSTKLLRPAGAIDPRAPAIAPAAPRPRASGPFFSRMRPNMRARSACTVSS
jgi:hypothetical protein